MNYENLCQSLFEEIEDEYSKRIEELNSFENFLNSNPASDDFSSNYRKMLVVMLYSYFEGFCKKTFLIYIDYINRTNIDISNVKDGLVASSLETDFQNLFNSSYKPVRLGDKALREDGTLQLYGRQREFIAQYISMMKKKVCISDKVVDTDSNLKSYVLKKILFKLEIDFSLVDEYQNDLNELVNKRNALAHGDRVRGLDEEEYNNYKKKTVGLMGEIKRVVYENYSLKKYMKNSDVA